MNMDLDSSGNYTDLILNDAPEALSNLGTMGARIAYHNFGWRYVTLILFNTIHIVALQPFLMKYNQTVVINLIPDTPVRRTNILQYVIFSQSSTEILSTLRWIVRSKYDTSGKYIIICSSAVVSQCNEKLVFQALSILYMPNVIFLKVTDHNVPVAYTYQIIKPGNCNNSEPERLNLTLDCENDSCFSNLYPERLGNFHRCPFAVSTINQAPYMVIKNDTSLSGFDGYILNIIVDIMNATLIVKTPADVPAWGSFVENNWTGSYGDVFNGRVDASMCSAPLSSYTYGNFQISSVYYFGDIVWTARRPPPSPPWENIIRPLSFHVRTTLFFIFIVIVLVNLFLKTNVWKIIRPKYSFLFYSWLLFLGMPIHKLPSRRTFLIFIYSWVWFSFVIRCAYQAALISSLKTKVYGNRLQSGKEVFNHPYGGAPVIREYYQSSREVYDSWTVIDSATSHRILDEILDGTNNLVLALNIETLKYYYMINLNSTKGFQVVPEKIVTSPFVIYFRKSSPIEIPISRILRSISEAGFIEHARSMYFDTVKYLYKLELSAAYGPKPLTIEHFSGIFYVLIAGWFVSSIYFAVEVVCGLSLSNQQS